MDFVFLVLLSFHIAPFFRRTPSSKFVPPVKKNVGSDPSDISEQIGSVYKMRSALVHA